MTHHKRLVDLSHAHAFSILDAVNELELDDLAVFLDHACGFLAEVVARNLAGQPIAFGRSASS